MKSILGRTVAALVVIVALAGCAATGAQESWFNYLDRARAHNAGDFD